jgi:hypothetical protein
MATLADLAPISETVAVRGAEVEVYPLSLATIGSLVFRFPALSSIFDGGDVVETLLSAGDEVVCAVIDAATGSPKGSAARLRLSAVEQGAIVLAAVEMTLPEQESELVGFLNRLAGLMGRAAQAAGRT